MHDEQWTIGTVDEVLASQARSRAEWSGEAFDVALKAVTETGAGRQEDLTEERDKDHQQAQKEDRNRTQRAAAWELFMKSEQRELELRKDGQLARLLGEPLLEESPAALGRLAHADQSQAEKGLVALMSGGKTSYKPLEDLSEEDVPARVAANRLRMAWLKERKEVWGGYGD
ncbi:MAG: hypothetical protein WA990_05000 [Rubrobacteraceae bacterium]